MPNEDRSVKTLVFVGRTSFCWFCHAVAQIVLIWNWYALWDRNVCYPALHCGKYIAHPLINLNCVIHKLSPRMTKRTKSPLHPLRTQISLGICPSLCRCQNLQGDSEDWSDWANGSSLGTQVILLVWRGGGAVVNTAIWWVLFGLQEILRSFPIESMRWWTMHCKFTL